MRNFDHFTPQQRRAQNYLARCRWARERALGQAAALEELRALGMQVGRTLTGLPGARRQTSQVESTVERIERCAQELEVLTGQYLDQYRQLQALLDRLGDPRLAALLRMREMRQCSWQEIGQEMGVTERWARALHREALQALGQMLPAPGEAGPDEAAGGPPNGPADQLPPEPPANAPGSPAPRLAPRPAADPVKEPTEKRGGNIA